jgi:D-3-phosphoglycerate dehydrogenase
MTTVYVPDPMPSLHPFAEERAVAAVAGVEFVVGDDRAPIIQDAEIILTAYLPFSYETMRRLPRCRLIVRYGIGVDSIDLEGATRCGIVVANAPTYCVDEVSDHTAALILSLGRRIPWLDREVRAGNWATVQQEMWGVRRLSELTLGIVGLGKIGRLVVRKMAPFGFRILGHDPNLRDGLLESMGVSPRALDDLLSESDVVSLHVPLLPATRHLIDDRRLRLMKPSASLINTSRGPVVDEAALVRALQEHRLFGAALDVLEKEPPANDNPLFELDPQRVILTPHFAASSEAVTPAAHCEVTAAMASLLRGEWPAATMNPNVVPKQPLRRA